MESISGSVVPLAMFYQCLTMIFIIVNHILIPQTDDPEEDKKWPGRSKLPPVESLVEGLISPPCGETRLKTFSSGSVAKLPFSSSVHVSSIYVAWCETATKWVQSLLSSSMHQNTVLCWQSRFKMHPLLTAAPLSGSKEGNLRLITCRYLIRPRLELIWSEWNRSLLKCFCLSLFAGTDASFCLFSGHSFKVISTNRGELIYRLELDLSNNWHKKLMQLANKQPQVNQANPIWDLWIRKYSCQVNK